MTPTEFQKVLDETTAKLEQLTESKGREYRGSDDDQLANFYRSAKEAGIKPTQAWLVFFNKHIDAIKSFIRTESIFSEPIEGRIDDAILYLILLKALLRDLAVESE